MARGNSFEGGSDETTVTNANSGGTSGTAFTSPVVGTGATVVYDNAQAHHGTFSCRTATGGTSALAYTNWTWTAKGEDYCRGHFRFTSLPSAQQPIIRYLNGGSQALRVNVKTDGTIEVRNAANSVITPNGTTANAISAGSWFRIELRVTASTTVGAIELRLYLGPNSSTPTETLSMSSLALTANVDEIRFGVGAAMSNAVQVWQDNVAADHTTWFGPALVTGTAARATTFGTAAAGTRTVLGTAARATTFGTTAAGVKTVLGTAARATVFGTSAAGVRETSGTGAHATTFTTTAEGVREVLGTAPRGITFATSTEGLRMVLGAGSRPITFSTTAEGGPVLDHTPTPVLVAAAAAPTLGATTTGTTLTATASRTTLAATV